MKKEEQSMQELYNLINLFFDNIDNTEYQAKLDIEFHDKMKLFLETDPAYQLAIATA